MDPLYIRLVRELDNNGLKDCNHGLLHGLTGITIFYYHLAKVTGIPDYEERADDLIGKVFSDLSLSVPADFENGLAGIGWGIEYLVRKGFAEGNTDEILEEADNKIFRILNEETLNSFDLTNGLTGYLIYLIYRLKNNKDLNSDAFKINCESSLKTQLFKSLHR
jgi:lantibiotic modifying enzyme